MVFRAEEYHIVRTRQQDVFPPFRRGKRQIDQRLDVRLLGDPPLIFEMDLEVFRAVVAVGGDPLFLPKRYMNGHRVPCAIRKVLFVLPGHLDSERGDNA